MSPALVGQRLVRHWAIWQTNTDAWFCDGPAILEFDQARLEVAAFKTHV